MQRGADDIPLLRLISLVHTLPCPPAPFVRHPRRPDSPPPSFAPAMSSATHTAGVATPHEGAAGGVASEAGATKKLCDYRRAAPALQEAYARAHSWRDLAETVTITADCTASISETGLACNSTTALKIMQHLKRITGNTASRCLRAIASPSGEGDWAMPASRRRAVKAHVA